MANAAQDPHNGSDTTEGSPYDVDRLRIEEWAEGPDPAAELESIAFDNTEVAFRYKTDADLRKSHLLFNSIKYNFLVRIGPPLVSLALDLKLPVDGLIRRYFFSQFCGGVSLQDSLSRIELLWQHGAGTILDYAVEAQKSEVGYNSCMQHVLEAIEFARQREEVSYIAVKLTGLGGFGVLEKAQLQDGELHGYEKIQYDHMVDRLDALCKAADEAGQSLLVDAEESWIQGAIDRIVEDLMAKYNKERAVVYTTAQMYRHDRLDYVKELFLGMRRRRAIPAVKLVRGAYLEKESLRARKLKYPNPLNHNKAATDELFNQAAVYILERLDKFAVCAGTHNEESCRLMAQYTRDHKIASDHPHLVFSQLLGMSDHLTFNLSRYGFRTAKYLPYGPLDAVLPYLFRRAQENSSIAGQSGRELTLIQQELHRRRLSSAMNADSYQLGHVPV